MFLKQPGCVLQLLLCAGAEGGMVLSPRPLSLSRTLCSTRRCARSGLLYERRSPVATAGAVRTSGTCLSANEGPAPAGPSPYSPALLLGQVLALHATEYLGQGEQTHPGQPVCHRQQPGSVSILPGRHQCCLYLVQDLALPLGAGLSDVAVTANQPPQQPLFRDEIRRVRVMDDLRPLWVMVVDAHCWASYRRSSGAAGCKAGCSLRIRFRIAC